MPTGTIRAACVEVVAGGIPQTKMLERPTLVGRSTTADLSIDHPSVSRRHAEFIPGADGRWTVRDLHSRNGTRVNGIPVSERALKNSDQIGVGEALLRFSILAAPTDAEGEDAPGFTITAMQAAQPPRLSADHVSSILAFGRSLQNAREGSERLRRLLELLVTPEMGGWWSYALHVTNGETDDLEIRPLSPPGTSTAGQSREPHISRNVLRAVLSGHEPVVANNLARVQNFQVEFSMASDSSHFSAVACPLDWEADSVDAIYVILPPALGSLEWLMLISLAVEQYRHANAAWAARLSVESRAALDHEMKLAQKIQAATLPASDPAIALDWAVRFEPCLSVGGDYVDVFRRPDGAVLLLIADAAGKGMQAALITSGLHAVFHTLGRNDCPLAEVVSAANRYLHAYLPDGSFVTLCATLLDPSSGEGTCVNCGHPPILVLDSSGNMRAIGGGTNFPLGLCDGIVETVGFRLDPGEWLIGYTDGLSEMFNDRQEMLGSDLLVKELVRQCADSGCNANQLADRINTWLDEFRGPASVADDRTFLVARRKSEIHRGEAENAEKKGN